jgi:hypothetical protein
VKVVKDAGCKGIVIEIPASDHMIQYGYGWPIERAMKASIETTLAAKEAASTPSSSPSTRPAPSSAASSTSSNRWPPKGHMDSLTIADTTGGCTPDAIRAVVPQVIKRINKPVEIHCHQDFGLGVANTIAALQAGASVAQTTITGLGERAGNVPGEDVILALLCAVWDRSRHQDRALRRDVALRDGSREGEAATKPSDRRRQAVRSGVGHYRRLGAPRTQRTSTRVDPVHAGARRSESRSRSSSARTAVRRRWKSGAKSWASRQRRAEMAMLKEVKALSFAKKDLLTADEFKVIADRCARRKCGF